MKQLILCSSEKQLAAISKLFPKFECRYVNGSMDWSALDGMSVVCFGEEQAHFANAYAAEVKVIAQAMPADLTLATALAWAKANAVPYNAAAQDSVSARTEGDQSSPPNQPVAAAPNPVGSEVPVPDALAGAQGGNASVEEPSSPSPAPELPARPDADAPQAAQDDVGPPPTDWPEESLLAKPEQPERHSEAWIAPDAANWPKPHDFWGSTHLPDLSEDWLPAAVAPFALDQAALIGGDSAQMAINVPVLCAAAIREQIGLQMQPGNDRWIERARLWGAVVGDASTKKGPMQDAVLRHFMKKDIEIRKANEDALTRYEMDAKKYQFAESAWIKECVKNPSAYQPVAPERPLSERLWTDDATLQALGKILSHHARGKILIAKDELAAWFGSFDQFTNAKDSDRANYLSSYEGKSKYIDRVDGGRAMYLPTWSVAILGGIQPSAIARISSKLGEDGMLARFMVVVAQETGEGEERSQDRDAMIAWIRVVDNLIAMQPGPEPVRFDPDAQEYRRTVGQWIHKAMRSGMSSPIVSALGKWEGLFGRLVLTYHCIESAAAGLPQPRPEVSLDTCARAWGLMKNLLWPNMFHFYMAAMGGKENSDSMRLANFILARLHDDGSAVSQGRLTTTELAPWAHWRTMRNEDPSGRRTQNLLDHMTQSGWISPILGSVSSITRKFSQYTVNPYLADRFADQAIYARAERAKWAALMPEKMPSKRREPGEDG